MFVHDHTGIKDRKMKHTDVVDVKDNETPIDEEETYEIISFNIKTTDITPNNNKNGIKNGKPINSSNIRQNPSTFNLTLEKHDNSPISTSETSNNSKISNSTFSTTTTSNITSTNTSKNGITKIMENTETQKHDKKLNKNGKIQKQNVAEPSSIIDSPLNPNETNNNSQVEIKPKIISISLKTSPSPPTKMSYKTAVQTEIQHSNPVQSTLTNNNSNDIIPTLRPTVPSTTISPPLTQSFPLRPSKPPMRPSYSQIPIQTP